MNYRTDNATKGSPTIDDIVPGDSDAADRRRRGLRNFLKARHLRVADPARSLGLSTANAFYNFINGHSDSLSLPMVEMILNFYPDTTFDEIVGRPTPRLPQAPPRLATWVPRAIVVRSESRAGLWRATVELPPERQVTLPCHERPSCWASNSSALP